MKNKNKKFFECHLDKIENVLKLWKIRDKIKINITNFKTLANPKIVHLGLITSVSAFIIEQLSIIKKILRKKQNKTFYFI